MVALLYLEMDGLEAARREVGAHGGGVDDERELWRALQAQRGARANQQRAEVHGALAERGHLYTCIHCPRHYQHVSRST